MEAIFLWYEIPLVVESTFIVVVVAHNILTSGKKKCERKQLYSYILVVV